MVINDNSADRVMASVQTTCDTESQISRKIFPGDIMLELPISQYKFRDFTIRPPFVWKVIFVEAGIDLFKLLIVGKTITCKSNSR
jgi:hypothetical protein